MFKLRHVLFLLLLSGIDSVTCIFCHNCLSFDKYDPNCVSLRGKGRNNVDKYYLKCSVFLDACSMFVGNFVHAADRPHTIVWRQCDKFEEGEEECRPDRGPSSSEPTVGTLCRCRTDFCNWRDGVDVLDYAQTRRSQSTSTSSRQDSTSKPLRSAAAHPVTVITLLLCGYTLALTYSYKAVVYLIHV